MQDFKCWVLLCLRAPAHFYACFNGTVPINFYCVTNCHCQRFSNKSKGNRMLSSHAKLVLLVSLSIPIAFVDTIGQLLTPPPAAKMDNPSVRMAQVPAADSLSRNPDTLANRIDTSAIVKDTLSSKGDTLDIIMGTESLNTIPGFRVQISSTQDLTEALDERTSAQSIFVGYDVYIIYDSPNYKVRVGDFRSRYDATQAATFIVGHGYPGAWVVPDNVFKNPTKKGGTQ